MLKMIDIPPVWLAAFAALAWGQARYIPTGAFGPWAPAAGALLIGAGLLLMALAVLEFARARTTVIPHREPAAIVTSGIFAWSRNPIYLGDALILAGLVLRWDAVASLLLVPVFVFAIDRHFVRGEESRLAAAFPAEFEAYRASVRRWI